ncbi:MAG: P-loop NTPase fold protein, partial [Candidatus Sericytochromatia bacterium]
MSNKLFSNNPTDLEQVDGDLFGTKYKAEAIKEFLESIDTTEKDSIKMLCLYGNWGSGKSSIINYLQTKLSENRNIKTKVFEAWQHEKDNDLTLSLSECIASLEKTSNKIVSDFVLNAIRLVKGGLKSLTIKFGDVSLKMSDIFKEFEEKYKDISFYTELENFKKSFIELEDSILGKDNDNKIIIFIDDL